MPLMSFLARWDSQHHKWVIEERKDGITTKVILDNEAFRKYANEFRHGSDTSFWKRLRALWNELDHTKYQWKDGRITPVGEV